MNPPSRRSSNRWYDVTCDMCQGSGCEKCGGHGSILVPMNRREQIRHLAGCLISALIFLASGTVIAIIIVWVWQQLLQH